MAKQKFDPIDAVNYFNGTSLVIESYLRDNKLPASLAPEVRKEVERRLSECNDCGTWWPKSKIVDGLCNDCKEMEEDE